MAFGLNSPAPAPIVPRGSPCVRSLATDWGVVMVSASWAGRARALFAMALFASATLTRAASADPPDPRDPMALLDSQWLSNVKAGIEREEYHLSPSDTSSGYTAPNRAQDLRATWDAGTLIVTPRVDPGAWRFTLALAAVT